MALDPLYVKKGCQVKLARGARSDSTGGPVMGGNESIDSGELAGKKKSGISVANPRAQPTATCTGGPDGKAQAPVRWDHDGTLSMVKLADLELVQIAPTDKEDPVKARAAEHRKLAAENSELRATMDSMASRLAKLEAKNA